MESFELKYESIDPQKSSTLYFKNDLGSHGLENIIHGSEGCFHLPYNLRFGIKDGSLRLSLLLELNIDGSSVKSKIGAGFIFNDHEEISVFPLKYSINFSFIRRSKSYMLD